MGFPPFSDHFVNAVHDAEKADIHDQKLRAQAAVPGELDESQISGLIALGLVQVRKAHSEHGDTKRQTSRFLIQLALQDYIDGLNQDIADLEAGFAAQFGDAWREEIALRVFGEDQIPQRNTGETIEEYRARLELDLIATMLNPDGSIKAEYKEQYEFEKFAEWAQKIYHRDQAIQLANELKDPATTHEQAKHLIEWLEEARNSEQNNYAARALDGNEAGKQDTLNVDDRLYDGELQNEKSAFSQDFLSNPSQ